MAQRVLREELVVVFGTYYAKVTGFKNEYVLFQYLSEDRLRVIANGSMKSEVFDRNTMAIVLESSKPVLFYNE